MLFSTAVVAALAGSSLVGAAPILEARKAAPSTWAHSILEEYLTYHTRYLALECYKQHDTQFFDDCCRPLLASQSLDDRAAECRPSEDALKAASERIAARISASPSNIPSVVPSDDAVSQWVSDAVEAQKTTEPAANLAAAPAPTKEAEKPAPKQEEPKKEEPKQDSNNDNQGDGQNYAGIATFYDQSEGADPSGDGSCGWKNTNDDMIAAVQTMTKFGGVWGTSSKPTICGRKIRVTNPATGMSVDVTVVDSCPTCYHTPNDLDLSPAAFMKLGNPEQVKAQGEVPITWRFI